MKPLLRHKTRRGPVFICVDPRHRFHVVWKDESLGAYDSAIAAADDAAGGHTFSPSDGTDLGELDISPDAIEWEEVIPGAHRMAGIG